MDEHPPQFLFTTCQAGAERVLKAEMDRLWPDFRPAFSRRGFITFKLPPAHGLRDDFDPHAGFARSHGFSLGKVTGESDATPAEAVRAIADLSKFDELHVWQRGEEGSPAVVSAATVLGEAHGLQSVGLGSESRTARLIRSSSTESPASLIFDCVIVEPNEWWLGYHRAVGPETRWPGGIYERPLPPDMVSRAFLKMGEALAWSHLPVKPGEHVAEIGCAPGGASQALLERGLLVTGIDPADVDRRVIAHPNFTHIRKRGHDVKRREFRKTRWLTADMNVAPRYTLDTVEAIVTHADVDIRGMLLTLKLLEWSLAVEVPEYLARIRSWGYGDVRARQLSQNRQEICVSARRKTA